MLPKVLCFLDVETTGMRATYDRIIEIGILRVENGKVVKRFNSLVNPGDCLPSEITQLTGITSQDLETAPSFRQIKNEIKEILADAIMVAHNARFDYSFLKNEFKRLEESFSQKHFCSVKLARKLFPQWTHHNLDSLISNLKINCKNRHRAFDDALVLHKFFQEIQKEFSEDTIKEAINFALKHPSLPLNLDREFLKDLPECCGVYIFYGKSGAPLYVGKSINLRDRILSHFQSDHSNPFDMKISQQIESIETVKTAGELGALLLESELIKKLQPLYNRKLRINKKIFVLKSIQGTGGYFTAKLEDIDYIDSGEIDQVIGVFRSKKQAKEHLVALAKEKMLCQKLLGLEKGSTACFSYRLGLCQGACLSKENPKKYNLRFIEAFINTKIKPWPYKGKIVISEKDVLEEKSEEFVVDKWCLLDRNFDIDTYKILERHLRLKSNITINFLYD